MPLASTRSATDVCVYPVGEVDRSRPPRQGMNITLGGQRKDLVGVEIELEVLQELTRVG